MSLTPSRGERAGRDGAFTSRRGLGEGSPARTGVEASENDREAGGRRLLTDG